MKNNKWLIAITSLIALTSVLYGIAMTTGCKSPPEAGVYRTEKLIADAATSAVHTFNVYYKQQTATAPASADLEATRTQIYDASRKLSAMLNVVDQARLNYTQNPAQTNQSSMFIALQAASDQSSNIVAVVNLFRAAHPAK